MCYRSSDSAQDLGGSWRSSRAELRAGHWLFRVVIPKLCTPETVLRWERPTASVRPNDVRLQVIENTGQSVHRILCTEV